MRPGEGEVLLVLDTQAEIKALEAGLTATNMRHTEFASQVFKAGYEWDKDAGHPTPLPDWVRRSNPVFEVTSKNIQSVQTAAEATRNIPGIKGIFAILAGRKFTAQAILEALK